MFVRRLRCAPFATHIELENAGDHDHGLRPIAVLKHGKPERLGAIEEDSTAAATPVPNHPISPSVPADHKE
jgi:hypothetical protein